MNLNGLRQLLARLPAYRGLLERMGDTPLPPQALFHAARPLIAAGLAQDRPGPLLFVTATEEQAQQALEVLQHFLPSQEDGGPPLLLFPQPDALPYERIPWTDRTRQQRLTALAALTDPEAQPVILASLPALLQKTLPPRELRLALRPLRVGSFLRLESAAQRWVQMGYEPTEVVEEPGTFARRGGIVDIWPPNLPHPVRVELFGDDVESLRIFDPATQRTIRPVEEVALGPGSEALGKYGPQALERLGDPLASHRLLLAIQEEMRRELERLAQGHSFRGVEWYLPYFYPQPASLLDYLPAQTTLLLDDGGEILTSLHEVTAQAGQLRQELAEAGELPDGFASSFFKPEELLERLAARTPLILGFGDLEGRGHSANTPLARSFAPAPRYAGKIKQVRQELQRHLRAGQRALLVSHQAQRLQEELAQGGLFAQLQDALPEPPGPGLTLLQGVLPEGFLMKGLALEEQGPPVTLHLLTDRELFGWKKAGARRPRRRQSKVAPEIFFADVKPGDFVVHMEHGIGRYQGLVKKVVDGMEREYLQVNYAQEDKLYVPVHQADRLSRYVGGENRPPPITRLGAADWQLVKERAKRAVADMAEELLALYAERELAPGHAFSPDNPWQVEMEEQFPYQETEDQLAAIEAVKRDMERPRPMDRLICGDVGYGKTEVAIRAAFKAVLDGKQVAVLVPTTVLAQQHFRTFRQRLARFPVRVEMLSRFRTRAQQERILAGLQEGTVDIVIGTHRLLSKDLAFKDLGLLVVDEEQRFGVAHKERLKQLRTQVDVLTLSATPIPRTLHMGLSGARDMSVINTPPRERMPVHTVLSEYDEVLIRQAIRRELDREGQVFFVHNRVQGIEQMAARIRRLIPEARVDVAHGQMPERELEEVMLGFAEGAVDVLVCTTIVENGLDIRNANTMIINRADHFGLAQLYQLRGRVGRGAVRGYCYLLYDRHKALTFDARRRLEALLESSEEMGAGFRIAMRDLEIRGAGELLGPRQHGHMAAVGFDLYTRLLAQAINELREKKKRFDALQDEEAAAPVQEASAPPTTPSAQEEQTPLPFALEDPLAPPVTLDLPLLAEIPEEYVPDSNLRLQLYRRIAGLTRPEEIQAMRQELLDRFGPDRATRGLPLAVENLLFQIQVKNLAVKAGVSRIGRQRDHIAIRTGQLTDRQRRQLQQELRLGLGQLDDEERFVPDESVRVGRQAVTIPIDPEERWRERLVRALEVMGTMEKMEA